MHDPLEGVTAEGTIRTGADRARIPADLWPVLEAAVDLACAERPEVSVYVYGSVATGQAKIPTSDVDLLTIQLPVDAANQISGVLSSRFGDLCRGVEIAVSTDGDFVGEGDEAYGGRVFLHHYCVHLAGPERDRAVEDFPADDRAVRGFNGDIALHARRWRHDLAHVEPEVLGRRVARKTLLAVAGLVSIRDDTWTTDRDHAARRWSQIEPDRGDDLERLLAWSSGRSHPTGSQIATMLDDTIDGVVTTFGGQIGFWNEPPSSPH